MANFKNISEKIDNYILGQLPPKEEASFRLEIQVNDDLKREVKFRRLMIAEFSAIGKDKLIQKIKQVKENQTQKVSKIRKLILRSVSIAGVILVLIFLGGYWFTNQNYSNSALFSKSYQPTRFFGVTKVLGTNSPEGYLNEAYKAYERKNYDRAIEILSAITDTSTLYTTAQFNLGHSFLLTHQPQKAITSFKLVQDTGPDILKEDTEWYISLAYLQQGDFKKSKEILEGIIQSPAHSFHKKATVLNKNLNSFWRRSIFYNSD